MDASPTALVRVGAWRWLRGAGLERFELRRGEDVWLLVGTTVTVARGEPVELRHRVECDGAWRTRRVDVALRGADRDRSVQLLVAEGRWTVDGKEEPTLGGCVDVDLEWSPATNTLPVRRLRLAAGAGSGPLAAAWVRFPSLAVERLPQEYLQLAEDRYRYSSNGGTFTADLAVDVDGLVLDYPGVWERVGGR